jgi:hypothetical protein
MDNIEVLSENPIEIQLQEAAIELAKLKAKWNGCKSFLGPMANALMLLGIEPRLDNTLDNTYFAIYFSGDKEKLASVLRIVRVGGWQTESARPKKGDTTWSAFFDRKDTTVRIYFHFSSTVCKRVKIGTKTVRQDVYEVQCGDISDDETQAIVGPPSNAIGHAPMQLEGDIAN